MAKKFRLPAADESPPAVFPRPADADADVIDNGGDRRRVCDLSTRELEDALSRREEAETKALQQSRRERLVRLRPAVGDLLSLVEHDHATSSGSSPDAYDADRRREHFYTGYVPSCLRCVLLTMYDTPDELTPPNDDDWLHRLPRGGDFDIRLVLQE